MEHLQSFGCISLNFVEKSSCENPSGSSAATAATFSSFFKITVIEFLLIGWRHASPSMPQTRRARLLVLHGIFLCCGHYQPRMGFDSGIVDRRMAIDVCGASTRTRSTRLLPFRTITCCTLHSMPHCSMAELISAACRALKIRCILSRSNAARCSMHE